MKKILFLFTVLVSGLNAQSPRLSLFEEFTGETCNPCAATNPGLNNILLSTTNAGKIVAIKWQVPIPSAPSNTWSLYQTDKTEIDWRWKSGTGNYNYLPNVTFAPYGKIDGQDITTFGAASNQPANLSNGNIATAQSYSSAFNIIMTRDAITNTSTAANVNVTIQATAPYHTTSPLVFRNVLVERVINFSVQPGTNGEKDFYDPARKSYPDLQNGTSLPGTWTVGQVYTFSMNCVFPTYIHSNSQIEFVGFIQNDGTQKVEQACRTSMTAPLFDAAAAPVSPPFMCSPANTMAPVVTIKNNGQSAITSAIITPYIDGVAKNPTNWSGSIAPGFSGFIQLNAFSSATVSGTHTFSYSISGTNGTDVNSSNDGAAGSFYGVYNYQSAPIAEGFATTGFPYAGWKINNPDNGSATWSFQSGVDGYNWSTTGNSMKYNFFGNKVIGDKDELFLPPVDLSGVGSPTIAFDVAYHVKTLTSSDKLELMLSNDCGNTWTSMWSAAGLNLAAYQLADNSGFVSNVTAPDWITFTVSLPGYNVSNVLVKFVTTNQNGDNLYLDNINLSATAIPDGIHKNGSVSDVMVYPNPNNGLANIRINSNKNESVKLTVLNSVGQLVLEKQLNLVAGTNNSIINLEPCANGIYSLRIEGQNFISQQKIALSK